MDDEEFDMYLNRSFLTMAIVNRAPGRWGFSESIWELKTGTESECVCEREREEIELELHCCKNEPVTELQWKN